MPIKKIALTGGPSGGKTTTINHLQKKFGNQIIFAPEAATTLLSSDQHKNANPNNGTAKAKLAFQQQVIAMQIELEKTAEKASDETKTRVIICDRGLADGAAYLPGGLDQLSDMSGINWAEILARYDLVIHLVTSAKQARGYDKESNIYRAEESERAIELDDRTIAAWNMHPNRIIIDENDGDKRLKEIDATITDFLRHS